MVVCMIHQFFFDFGDGKVLTDFPHFSRSLKAFRSFPGWQHKLWTFRECADLCAERHPEFYDLFSGLPKITQLDVSKYMVAQLGGLVADLDVLPCCCDLSFISSPYVFDFDSRDRKIGNDLFYMDPGGLPGILDYFVENWHRKCAIDVYRTWRLRFVFQTSGPDFFTRYLRQRGLHVHACVLSTRTFPHDPTRNRIVQHPLFTIEHRLTWAPSLSTQAFLGNFGPRDDSMQRQRREIQHPLPARPRPTHVGP